MLPENVDFGAEMLAGYSRNCFRIEPNSADTAKAGRVIQIQLPENSVLDMKSFRLFGKVTTVKGTATSPTQDIYGLLPANLESLISNVEIFVNGVQVSQGNNEYNTICKILKLGAYNQDAQQTSGVLVNHAKPVATLKGLTRGNIFGDNSGNGEIGEMCIDNWCNFLGTTATRFLPTDVLGSITVRITLAQDSVLNGAIDDSPADDVSLNFYSLAPSYNITDIFATVESCVLPDAYNELLRRRLSEQYLPLNYKEYYAFVRAGNTGTAYTNRFALSSGCINALYAVQRSDKHNVFGPATDLAPSTGADRSPIGAVGNAIEGKFFTYKTFKKGSDCVNGQFRYQFNINNVLNPQFQATNKFAMSQLPYVWNKLTPRTQGILPSSETAFCRGQAVYSVSLCHPDLSHKVMSGLNSMGINSSLAFSAQGLESGQFSTDGMSSVVIVETVAQMRISEGRQISVVF